MSHFFDVFFLVLIKVVTLLFMFGVGGCAIVLVMTFWEDLKTIAGHRE